MSQDAPVLFHEAATDNGKVIGFATLNVEKTLNSLTLDMVELLLDKLQQWQSDERIAAVFLDGAGEKAFCAGGDVQQLHKSATDTPGGPCTYAETFFEREYRLDYLIHRYQKPIICWGHGIVMGGGLGLFAGCSHTVVTEKTRIAMPEITIALYPDVGGTWFLNRMPGKSGLFIALTGASINAADTLYAGLASHYSSHAAKVSIIEQLSTIDWQGQRDSDDAAINALFTEQCPLESQLTQHATEIDQLCAGDSLGTIVERITSLNSEDAWLSKASAGLAHGSSIAAHSIWQQHLKGCELSLEEVFQFELMLSTNVVRHPEFAEGVRALLIDKDRNPQWLYPTIEAVPESLVEGFLTPPWEVNPLTDIAV